MLAIYDDNAPYYVGANISSGSSAFVLSRESVRLLFIQWRQQYPECKGNLPTSNIPPVSYSYSCLDRLGIIRVNTLDGRGCERFLDDRLGTKLADYSSTTGRCMSSTVLSFSRVGATQFPEFEHLLYRLMIQCKKPRQ